MFEPGNPKPENSGRRAGTPNRFSRVFSERLAELNVDPIEILARIATDPKSSDELKLRAAAEMCAYSYPRLKSVAHHGAVPVEEQNTSGLDLIRARIDSLVARRGTEGNTPT